MRGLCVGLTAALAIITPASARAAWSPPRQVSHVDPGLETPRLTFDGKHDGFAAWDEPDSRNLYAAKLGPPTDFIRPQLLGDDLVLDDLSASRDGSVLVVATGRNRHGGRIETFVRRPGDRFRASQVLDRIPRPYAYFHHALLGADAAGDAAVVWSRARRKHLNSPLFMAVRRRGGRFGRARPISKSGVGAFSLAMNARGDFLVAWARGNRVEVRIGHGSKLGPARRLGRVNPNIPEVLDVAIDGAGDALVTWLGGTDVELAYRPAGFGFDAAHGLPHDPGAAFGSHLALAFASREHAVLAIDGSNSAGPGIFAFDLFQGGASPALRLAPPGPGRLQAPRLQGVAAGPRGQVAVWWAGPRTGGYTGTSDLFLSYRDSGGFSAPEQVSAPTAPLADTSGLPVSTVSFDPLSGQPVALWVANLSHQTRLPPGEVLETSTRQ